MPIPDVELAYLAGFFDGEGSIMILAQTGACRGPGRYRLVLAVSNTVDHSVVRYVLAFGGTVIPVKAKNVRSKSSFRWMITSVGAEKALTGMLPFLRVKKEQATVALEFRKLFRRRVRGAKLNSSEVEQRNKFVHRIKLLNAKGPVAVCR